LAKYNQLLRIEEELGGKVGYAGMLAHARTHTRTERERKEEIMEYCVEENGKRE
jgi:hypothetical protein